MATWQDLRLMREQGVKPSLPVMVSTDGANPAGLLMENGFLVIRHKPGEMFPVELLDGLSVLLFLGSCDRASAVVRMMVERDVQPLEIRSWCECYSRIDRQPVRCEVAHAWQ
jgi:hypothetical protein